MYIRMYPDEEVVIVVITNWDALDAEPHTSPRNGQTARH